MIALAPIVPIIINGIEPVYFMYLMLVIVLYL